MAGTACAPAGDAGRADPRRRAAVIRRRRTRDRQPSPRRPDADRATLGTTPGGRATRCRTCMDHSLGRREREASGEPRAPTSRGSAERRGRRGGPRPAGRARRAWARRAWKRVRSTAGRAGGRSRGRRRVDRADRRLAALGGLERLTAGARVGVQGMMHQVRGRLDDEPEHQGGSDRGDRHAPVAPPGSPESGETQRGDQDPGDLRQAGAGPPDRSPARIAREARRGRPVRERERPVKPRQPRRDCRRARCGGWPGEGRAPRPA